MTPDTITPKQYAHNMITEIKMVIGVPETCKWITNNIELVEPDWETICAKLESLIDTLE